MDGRGVERNVTYGVVMIGQAAMLGMDVACYCRGMWHRDGIHGFPKDEALTRKWFRKMETCEQSSAATKFREQAAEWLRAHPERP